MAVNLTFTFLDWAAYINNKYDGTDEDRENFIQQIESDFPANEEHNTFDIMQYMYDVDNTLALATNQSSNSDHPTPNLRQNQNTPSPINTIPSRPHNSYSNSSNHNNHSNNNSNPAPPPQIINININDVELAETILQDALANNAVNINVNQGDVINHQHVENQTVNQQHVENQNVQYVGSALFESVEVYCLGVAHAKKRKFKVICPGTHVLAASKFGSHSMCQDHKDLVTPGDRKSFSYQCKNCFDDCGDTNSYLFNHLLPLHHPQFRRHLYDHHRLVVGNGSDDDDDEDDDIDQLQTHFV
eukprot:106984_1